MNSAPDRRTSFEVEVLGDIVLNGDTHQLTTTHLSWEGDNNIEGGGARQRQQRHRKQQHAPVLIENPDGSSNVAFIVSPSNSTRRQSATEHYVPGSDDVLRGITSHQPHEQIFSDPDWNGSSWSHGEFDCACW
jgi:hypothetical protein